MRVDREGGFEGDGYRNGGWGMGEVEKVVGNRARVTASNNVFSPLCVLAARERAEGAGDEHAISILTRVAIPHVGPRLLIHPPQSISSILLVADGAWEEEGGEKGMKRGSLSRPRQPLALFVLFSPALTILRVGPLMDFYVRTMARHRSHRDLLFPTLARVLIKGII